MNILIYVESYLPNLGGLERNTRMLCRLLAKKADVTLVTPVLNKIETEDDEPFKIVRSISLIIYAKLIRNCDLLIVNGGTALKPLTCALLWNKPFWVIYQMASLFLPVGHQLFKKKLSFKLRKYAASKARLNIAVSEYSKFELQRLLPSNRCEVLINPFDEDLEQYIEPLIINKDNSKPFRLLFAGRLTEGKGVFLLVQAVQELLNTNPDLFELHIAGSGDAEQKLHQLITADKRFVYHGRVDQQALIQLYQLCHLTIIPSHTHIEGSPLTMAESIYCGTPVLVSDQPAMISSMGNAGFSFKSGSKEALKTALINYACDAEFRLSLMNHSKEQRKRFSVADYERKLNVLINVA